MKTVRRSPRRSPKGRRQAPALLRPRPDQHRGRAANIRQGRRAAPSSLFFAVNQRREIATNTPTQPQNTHHTPSPHTKTTKHAAQAAHLSEAQHTPAKPAQRQEATPTRPAQRTPQQGDTTSNKQTRRGQDHPTRRSQPQNKLRPPQTTQTKNGANRASYLRTKVKNARTRSRAQTEAGARHGQRREAPTRSAPRQQQAAADTSEPRARADISRRHQAQHRRSRAEARQPTQAPPQPANAI